jgi:hypothetical protein
MALLSRLDKYDAMINVLVDLLVRDLEAEPQMKTPPEAQLSEGAIDQSPLPTLRGRDNVGTDTA